MANYQHLSNGASRQQQIQGTDIGSGAATSSQFLAANGSGGSAFRSILSTDIPTLNQNTTGTASNITATSNSTLTTLSALTTASSLVTVGTIATGTWNGTTIAIANGGTGQTTQTSAFDALSPLTTAGDILYYNGTHNVRLALGSSGQVLTVTAGEPAWGAAGSGTVTSITVTVPSFLSVSPATITTSGTFAISLSGTALPVANGGTGDTSFTANQVLLGGTTSTGPIAQVAGGTSGYVLTSTGPTSAPTWQAAGAGSFTAPTVQRFLSTGSTVGYLFTVSSANATNGATYTNNGHTYTVLGTISSGTQLFTTQASAPAASGTLTKASGTGDSTITFSAAQAIATYTTPSTAPLYLRVIVSGAGGGGGGGGGSGGNGSNGTPSAFVSATANLMTTTGGIAGIGGAGNMNGGIGGTASIVSPAIAIKNITGGAGQSVSGVYYPAGGIGGVNPLGGMGTGSQAQNNVAATAGVANTGAGGGGGGGTNSSSAGGAGGGAGGYDEAFIPSPGASTTYYYTIGTGGTGGTATSSGSVGAAGGTGVVIVQEMYQ